MERINEWRRGKSLHRQRFIRRLPQPIIMLLILVPFYAFRSLGEVVGERVLFYLFFEPRQKSDVAPVTARKGGS